MVRRGGTRTRPVLFASPGTSYMPGTRLSKRIIQMKPRSQSPCPLLDRRQMAVTCSLWDLELQFRPVLQGQAGGSESEGSAGSRVVGTRGRPGGAFVCPQVPLTNPMGWTGVNRSQREVAGPGSPKRHGVLRGERWSVTQEEGPIPPLHLLYCSRYLQEPALPGY